MNALEEIKLEAQVIVEQLADRQINGMKKHYDEYQEWTKITNKPLMGTSYLPHGGGMEVNLPSSPPLSEYESIFKFIYMTENWKYDHEAKKYVLPLTYPTTYKEKMHMRNDKYLMFKVINLQTQTREGWEMRYREEFIMGNMVKLNRALAKYLTNDMTASGIHVRVGGDGAEVQATVDGMLFRTFGVLCGGDVQIYHYRYRSSLK